MGVFAAVVALILAATTTLFADTITRAQITIEATGSGSARFHSQLTVRIDGGEAKKALDLYLNRAVNVTGAESNGAPVETRSRDVAGTLLKRWTVTLPKAVGSGDTAVLTLHTEASAGSGVRVADDGGFLLPGSGWFPQTAPETDELPIHSTTFRVPAGMIGVAAGEGSGGAGPWTSNVGARPFAAWGPYERSEHPAPNVSGSSISVYRRVGRSSEVPRLDRVTALISAVATGLNVSEEPVSWKLVDVGQGVFAGGRGTILWDEEAAGESRGDAAMLCDREIGNAVTQTYWTERFRTVGPYAAWLSRGVAHYLGDVACIALDEADDRSATEALVIGSRRTAFIEGLAGDRPVAGIVPVSPDGPACLATRGALIAHMMAEAVPSRSRWVGHLGFFAREYTGLTVDLATFSEIIERRFATHGALWPLLDTTDLPDFRIVGHGRSEGRFSHRYRVEVANEGALSGVIEVATFAIDGHRLRSSRLAIDSKGRKAVLFDQPDHIAKIALDPRGTTLQTDIADEIVMLDASSVTASVEPYVPSFGFETGTHTGLAVSDFRLDLDSMSISDFNGCVAIYYTYHGPSGAVLLGTGMVKFSPSGEFAAGFEKALGQPELSFYSAKNMFVRFPLSKWKQIEPQLGDEVPDYDGQELFNQRKRIYQYMFQSYFADGLKAQVPPPGSSMVIFMTEGDEWRGLVRRPLKNGEVEQRLWDHLRGETIWEEIH